MKKEDMYTSIEKELMENPKISNLDLAKKCKVPVPLVEVIIRKMKTGR
ncbi:winged helix-turn-helix domain-containing protein [Alteribacter keqinensis]|nr:winged helix-turn-helix domain-containing protein [Alteribacter keqinensis]